MRSLTRLRRRLSNRRGPCLSVYIEFCFAGVVQTVAQDDYSLD